MQTKPKKAGSANLEKNRIIFFETGVVIALSISLIAFEWATPEKELDNHLLSQEEFSAQNEIAIVTRRKEEKPLIQEKPEIALIINEVPDDVEVPEFEFFNPEDIKGNDPYLIDIGPEEEEDFSNETYHFYDVKEKPLFNGESPDIAFNRFISKVVEYPAEARENGIKGRVVLGFVIDEKGRLTNIEVYNGIHPSLDSAAVEAVRQSPLWTPGKQRGRPVKVKYYFPITFRLN